MTANKKLKICLVSSVPSTLLTFYGSMISELTRRDFEVQVAASNQPKLNEIGKLSGCEVFGVEISRRISVFQDLISIRRLTRFFRNERPDIVHAHSPKGGLIGMISAFIAKVPTRIYTIHGLPMETETGFKRQLLRICEKLSCKLSHKVLVVSPSLKKKVEKEKICSSEKISMLCNGTACGIDLGRFNPSAEVLLKGQSLRKDMGIPEDAFVVGFIGRLVPDKGIEMLVDSFLELEKKHSYIYLLLAGALDNERETFKPELMEIMLNHPRIITIMERVDPVPYYAAMDVLTLPSRREGFGMTLLEAGAMKVPVVATRVTGCVDAVVDGMTGYLVESDDAEGLANAIQKLLDNPQICDSFGKAGRMRAEQEFNAQVLIEAHLSLYKAVGCNS